MVLGGGKGGVALRAAGESRLMSLSLPFGDPDPAEDMFLLPARARVSLSPP